MITFDLHSHTKYSHARDAAADMFQAAKDRGLAVFGFSEHSPRPAGYDYPTEYRQRLNEHLGDYVREVAALKNEHGSCRALFGMEIDWFEDEVDFVEGAARQFPFDYLLGSTHFLGHWGYDGGAEPWEAMDEKTRFDTYEAYFLTWKKMLATGLFNIAAHPDLIKIYTRDSFHAWMVREDSQKLVREALREINKQDMTFEISSAGLRKPCREIYPCPMFMRLAREEGVRISFSSDAHCTEDVAYAFPVLASYAKAFGYTRAYYYADQTWHGVDF